MKKLILISILIFSTLCVFGAKAKNVCIYPENSELSSYINNYFDGKFNVVKSSLKVADSDLETGDTELMHLICDLSGADYIIIPLKSELSGFNHLKIYCFDNQEERFVKIKEVLNNQSYSYGIEIIDDLASFLLKGKDLESFSFEIPDDTIPEIEIPSIQNDVLKPQWMKDKTIYENARNRFYSSFARSLLIFGAKTAFRSMGWGTFESISNGALCISITDMVKNMFDYFRYADYVSP